MKTIWNGIKTIGRAIDAAFLCVILAVVSGTLFGISAAVAFNVFDALT